MTLAQLSYERVRGRLPEFLPGESLPRQLAEGRRQAEAALLKYRPNFKFDIDEARSVVREIDAWATRNEAELAKAMQGGATQLPEALQLSLGSPEKFQQYLVASFTVAAAGLGPWMSGDVSRQFGQTIAGKQVDESWAREDAAHRLQLFGFIVRLEQDGDLAKLFSPQSMSGLGNPALIPAGVWYLVSGVVVIVAAIAAAAIVINNLYAKKVQVNNDLMREMCLRAQQNGDQKTVAQCVEATKDLQVSDPLSRATGELAKVLIVLGIGYLGIRYALPYVWEKVSERGMAKA